MASHGPDLKAIFSEALDRTDPLGRADYLDRACEGNQALRLEVEGLLKALDEAGGFLGSAVGPAATADLSPGSTASLERGATREGPGTSIGPYKLLQQIGEGGMGVVFMAEQERPVRRKVALKVIKPGLDTGQVIARFEAERQALAMMDHPNIARVLDVGATATGRPFFVMELVKGVPITEYCDRNHLSPNERLELFIPTCWAIQHAHQKGIIHRDIKPSNVLVTLHDGQAVPKVIDFGVAKAIDRRLTEKTMFTEFGAIIGTLEYMSPEQAEMGALDVDTRSDIYSLGVLLYELLTGSTPLERAKLRQAAYSEFLRRIREEEPTKPSTRLSESKDALPSISAQRKMEPARLAKLVRGDLDWIVMKSLEKDRTRRYETATGFARDIQRHLDGDAVEACPPSASYKLRKFARKHRTALGTAGAFGLLLVAATTISVGLAFRANRERVRALKAEDSARVQEGRAREREKMAIDAVKRFDEVIGETPELKNNPALAPLRARLLKEPRAFFQKLRDQLQADQETTPDSLARLADAIHNQGRLADEIGDKRDALRSLEESSAILERLVGDDPSSLSHRSELAGSCNLVGILLRETGRPREARATLERALAIRERLALEKPDIAGYRNDVSGSLNNIALLMAMTGRPREARATLERALAIRERLALEHPSVAEYRVGLAGSHDNLGNLSREAGRPAEALVSYERALAIRERLVGESPTVAEHQEDLASTHNNTGLLLREVGRLPEALASFERALAIRERLARENSSVTEFQKGLAGSLDDIGSLLNDTGRPAEAMVSYRRALAIRERLARENPSVVECRVALAWSFNALGLLQAESGRTDEALASHRAALALRERLALESPSVAAHQSDLAGSHNNIALLLSAAGRTDQALTEHELARTLHERMARENPSVLGYQSDLAGSHSNVAVLLAQSGRTDEARRDHELASEILERLAREHPESPDFASRLGGIFNNLAMIDLGAGHFEGAQARLKRAIEWQRKALASNPNHPTYRQFLANHLRNLIEATKKLGRADQEEGARRDLAALAASEPARMALDARLAAVLQGQAPKDEAERVGLASHAYEKALNAASARLFAEALAANPKLAEDRQARNAYNAACAATLAGCGRGKDDPAPDDAARVKLRRQALAWLRGELAAWGKAIDAGPAEAKATVAKTLRHWKVDTDLAGLRDEPGMAKLPEEERAAFRQLWADVDRLLARASEGQ